jgi:FAD/FMN-containing dehydrogenase
MLLDRHCLPFVRRDTLVALFGFVMGLASGCGGARTADDRDRAVTAPATERCQPGQACWPTEREWQQLRSQLRGKLEDGHAPLDACRAAPAGEPCAAALRNVSNPFYLQDQAGGTESSGWFGAWTAAPSAYAVAAESADDVAAAVNFARAHRMRLVVKGTGHDYLGRSNAPDSLLIWTHRMRQVAVQDKFVAHGCAGSERGVPAVSVGAGTRWLEAYQEVTGKHGRYVQGGGCTSVGAAGGFLQGGGFGSWSRKYGIAAAGLLEAEVVTADGKVIVANACQHPDLWWALRGGGGGTFGVVTRATLMTHPLPEYFGALNGALTATSDAAFRELLERFIVFYREQLNNEHWGEQVSVRGDNSLRLSLAFQGMRAADAERVWQPLRAWIERQPDRFGIQLSALEIPARTMWSFEILQKYAPSAIQADARPGEPAGRYWWAGDADQVFTYWYAYQSRWIPLDRFEGEQAKRLAAALFEASRHWTVGLHFNKAQAGASDDAVRRGQQTSMNPAVFQAATLAIIAASGDGAPGVPGHEPDAAKARVARDGVNAAMQALREAVPEEASYVNETDYFEPNWQAAFWGENYPKLLEIKRIYDPHNMFTCHHCVGSEGVVP